MLEEETIYQLIPKEYVPPVKQARYSSQYPYNIPPTGSTFANGTTSRPGVSNLNGNFILPKGPHESKGQSSTFGLAIGLAKPKPTEFIKKNTGRMGTNQLPEVKNNGRIHEDQIKPAVPRKDEKPIHGLKTNKNFIIANAVENILAAPKVQPQSVQYRNKKDYGTVPTYLQDIQKNINQEYDMIQTLHKQEIEDVEQQKYLCPPDEIQRLKEGLQNKWNEVNKQYQQITHIKQIDTIGLKRRKETCEKELAQLEKDMEKLSKKYIFIDRTQ